jgi:putative ABC transport system ATP-binding protein
MVWSRRGHHRRFAKISFLSDRALTIWRAMDAVPPYSQQPKPLMSVRNLHLRTESAAGPIDILRGIDLDVRAGEMVGLVGPSGSGETSLLMLLAGLERATSGSIQFAGEEITERDEDSLARWRRTNVGIVFQAFHLIPTMTAVENVAVPLELARRRDAFERAADALRAVGLAARFAHLPGQLSGGEQQRVALARALASSPALILADEPTGNLDQETGGAVMELLFHQVAESGCTLLSVTHNPSLAARCNRVIRLADGRIVTPVPA